jgi:DNA-binding SARP family transcriptional activator/tetratricopeptide (TPR) repeat protein
VRVAILGPFQLENEGRALSPGGSRQRAVLAHLALHANQVVPTERLLVDLWGEDVPASAVNALQAAVSRLRKVMPPDRLVTQAPGYVLRLGPEELDLADFTLRAGTGRRLLADGRPVEAAGTLRSALALWRGPALADFRYEPFAQAEIARLEEEHLACREDRVDADLAGGTGADLVAELRALVTEHPLRERLRGQLMRALYRNGRQSEALEVLRELRRRLREDLGIDPSPELVTLETAILRQDPALLRRGGPPSTAGSAVTVRRTGPQPGQLPGQLPSLPRATPLAPDPVSTDAGRASAVHPDDAPGDHPAGPRVRRLVTVLTVELGAHTPDGDPVDPEALQYLHSRAQAQLEPVLLRCGGRLLPGAGTRVGGVFGVDAVHEDDAVRATRAALEARTALTAQAETLRRDTGLTLTAQFSLATTEAIVVGGALPGFVGRASAEATGLAEAAAPWQILVSAETHALAAAAVDVELLPSGRLALLAARSGARPLPVRLDGPLVGRDRELGALLAAVATATAARVPALVTVLGDPGIGKTRLVVELASRLEGRAEVLTGRCLPYGEGITFRPLRELVREATTARTPPRELADVLTGQPDAAEVAAQLGRAFGSGAPGGSDATEIFWATRRLLETLGRRTPLVVVLEDLHWAEPTFLDLVESVARQAADVPLTLVAVARPELLDSRPEWGAAVGARRLDLPPLDDDAAIRLLAGLGGPAAVDDGTADRGADRSHRILEAAGGNPLYLEQLAAAREDGDLAGGRVPPTLQALLAARLDRLGPGERLVLACASVVGKDFTSAAVSALLPGPARARVDAHLRALTARGLLQEASGRRPGELTFRHALIQQAAYRGVPKAERAHLHLTLADWLETLPDMPDAPGAPGAPGAHRTELLGYHLEQAARYRREVHPFDPGVRPVVERATVQLRIAGAAAHELGDAAAAVRLFERADALLPRADALRPDVLTSLGSALFGAGRLEDAGAVLADAVRLATEHGADRALAHALVETLLLELHVTPESAQARAGRLLPELRRSFERLDDSLGMCRAWMLDAAVHWNDARSGAAERAWREAAARARRAGDRRHLVDCLCWLASAALWGPTPASVGIARCTEYLAEMEGVPTGRAEVYLHVAGLYAMQDDLDRAEDLLARGIAILEEVGSPSPTAVTEPAALVAMLGDRPERAEELLRREHASLRAMGERLHLATVAALLAQTIVAQGPHRLADAERYIAETHGLGGLDDPTTRMICDGAEALVVSARGDHPHAVELARSAVTAAEGTDLTNQIADTLLVLARVLDAAGRHPEAGEAAAEASVRYREKGNLRGLGISDRLLVGLGHR